MKKSNQLFEKLAMYEVMDLHKIYGGDTASTSVCSSGGSGDNPDQADNVLTTGVRADVKLSTSAEDSCSDPLICR